MEFSEQPGADRADHRHSLFSDTANNTGNNTGDKEAPVLQKEVLDQMAPTFSMLKETALEMKKADSRQSILNDLDILSDGLKQELGEDSNKIFKDFCKVTDHRKRLLVDTLSFQADLMIFSSSNKFIQSNSSLGIGAIGAVGAIQATSDIVRLSKSENLGDAAVPAVGLVADLGMVAGAASFLSTNPTIAKYRAQSSRCRTGNSRFSQAA